jgi:hypothetical protein
MICSSQESKGFYTTSYVRGQSSHVLNQEFLFLVHKYWGSEVTRLGGCIGSYKTCSTRKPCAKAVPETDYFTQQKQYHTTLCLLKILLWSICSEEGPHYRFEQSVRKLSYNKQQLTYSQVWISLWWFHTRAVLHSLTRPRSHKKVSVQGFLWERKVWIMFSPTDVHSRNLR